MNGDKDKPQNLLGRWIEYTNDGFAKWYHSWLRIKIPNKITEKRQARRWRRNQEKIELRNLIDD